MLFIVALVVFIIAMCSWLGFGYIGRDPARPYGLGNTLAAWVAVLILGLIVFGAIDPRPPAMQVVPVR